MKIEDIELCATYWTVSGAVYPGAPSEISPFPLKDRAEVAGRVGWRGMGFVLDDMEASIARYGLPTVRRIFADNGIRHVELEFLVDWHLDGEKRRASEPCTTGCSRSAPNSASRRSRSAAASSRRASRTFPPCAAAFARICERAAPLGIDIVIEFLPFASINTIDRGLALFDGLGTTNGGLLVDTWHVQRGGMTAEDIRKIRSSSCGPSSSTTRGPRFWARSSTNSTHYRRLCGEGSIDIPSQLQAILDVGYRGYWGVEMISAYHRHLPLEIAAQRAFDATMQQFRAVNLPAD